MPWAMTFWMMTGGGNGAENNQKPTTATPMVFCKSGSVEVGSYIQSWSVMKIENALGDERGRAPSPAATTQNADKIHEVAVAGCFRAGICHETDEARARGA